MASKEVSFTPNTQMRAALERQAQIDQDSKAAVVKRALRAYLSQRRWSTDYLDGIAGTAPRTDGAEPFPGGWNQRSGQ